MNQNKVQFTIEAIDKASKTLDAVWWKVSELWGVSKWFSQTVKDNADGLQTVWTVAAVWFAWMSFLMKGAVDESNKMSNAFVWLKSVVEWTGGDFTKAKAIIDDYTKDWLVWTADAATSLKNLLSRWYWLDQAADMMNRFKDSASFGRQSALSMGEAVKSATEGIKNENSILVDNAGVTKNVSMMWKDYADAHWIAVNDMTKAQKIEAEYQGVMKETAFQVWDAAKYTKEYAWIVAKTEADVVKLKVSVGDQLKPVFWELLLALQPVITWLTDFTKNNPELVKWLVLWTTAVLWLTAWLIWIGFAIPAITTAVTAIGAVIWAVSAPIWLAIGAVVALTAAWKTNFLWIRDITDEVWWYIKWAFATFQSEYYPQIRETLQNIQKIFIEVWNWIWSFLQPIVKTIVDFFKNNWDTIKNIISSTFDIISWVVKIAWAVIYDTIKLWMQLLTWDWKGAWNTIKDFHKTVWDAMWQIVSGAWTLIKSVISLWLSAIQLSMNIAWEAIKWVIRTAWNVIVWIVSWAWGLIKAAVSDAIAGVKLFIQNWLESTRWIVIWILWWISLWFSNAFGAAKSVVESVMWTIKWVVQTWVWIITSIVDWMLSSIRWAVSYVSGALSSVTNAYSKITSTVSNAASSAANFVSKPFRALGWPVAAWQPYIVGERWMEVFVPNTAGKIVSNSDMQKWWWWMNLSINFGNVTLNNWLDLEDLADKIKSTIYEEQRRAQLWFI